MNEVNERAKIGGNNPPPMDEPTPEIITTINEINEEAKNWLDGDLTITTQDQCDALAKVIDEAMAAAGVLEKERKAIVDPINKRKTAVQAKFTPHSKICERIKVSGKAAMVPFIEAQEKKRVEVERKAREDEEAKQRAAKEALEVARESEGDLAAKEAAEVALEDAKFAKIWANKIGKETSGAKGGGRKVTLRTRFVPEIESRKEALVWIVKNDPDAVVAFVQDYADARNRDKKRDIDGIAYREEKYAV